eukprot:4876657-Pleurochrysis_carterae.AAC.4
MANEVQRAAAFVARKGSNDSVATSKTTLCTNRLKFNSATTDESEPRSAEDSAAVAQSVYYSQ